MNITTLINKKTLVGAAALALLGFYVGCGNGLATTTEVPATTFVQVERLARPAINEGLLLSNANLNAFNSIPPSFDLRSDVAAVAAVLTEAQVVLGVVRQVGITAGLPAPTVATVVGQFLPDVLRISTDNAHYAYALTAQASRTANAAQQEVAYASCVSSTSGAPLLCGGRKIRDDVIDITLTYIAGGNPNPSTGTLTAVPAYTVNDAVSYATAHPGALLATFPFLALPQ